MKTTYRHSPWLLVRADGSASIGTGHLMRCLALAQAWQDAGGRVAFAAAEIPESLVTRLLSESIVVHRVPGPRGTSADLDYTLGLTRELQADWVAIDGYDFDQDYLQALRLSPARLAVIDDMAHQQHYPADLLLNQNLSATPAGYVGRTRLDTTLLLGPRFSLLRREFKRARSSRPPLSSSLRVLVTFGGSDPENFTSIALRGLGASSKAIEVVALVGAANTHIDELRSIAKNSRFPCDVRHNTASVAALMCWADVAITAGGSTVWELACLGVPSLIAVHEDNQLAGATALASVPFFRVCPASSLHQRDLDTDIHQLANQSTDRRIVDAQGAVRVIGHMLSKMLREPVAHLI